MRIEILEEYLNICKNIGVEATFPGLRLYRLSLKNKSNLNF